jgi:glutathione S-transferase
MLPVMAAYELYVLDYNYSSWSMRAGVLMRLSGAEFKERTFHLDDAGRAQLRQVSPSGLLPLLQHGDVRVWDSLAIAEYLAEQFPEQPFWPRDPAARALARSASCEMHSGFAALRSTMAMNIRARHPGFARTPDAERCVRRIAALWAELRERFGGEGDYLCGPFGIIDAMYAPVVMRFRTYGVKLDATCTRYSEAVTTHPAVASWIARALGEDTRIPDYEYFVG